MKQCQDCGKPVTDEKIWEQQYYRCSKHFRLWKAIGKNMRKYVKNVQ